MNYGQWHATFVNKVKEYEMTTIRLINDNNIAESDFQTLTKGVAQYVPLITQAWEIKDVTVVGGGAPVDGDWLIYLTEKGRRPFATGYHKVQGGVPVAFCSPKASFYMFGRYYKPVVIKGKVVRPTTYRTGLLTTICHEVAEMLCDPYIKTVSAVDSTGKKWLVEVGDHVFGSYKLVVIDGQNCILPDATTPAFYDLKGKAPFSIYGGATAPFTLTPKGYAYYMDATGKLVKI